MPEPVPTGLFFLVVGPSGAGKDTLIDGLRGHAGLQQGFVFARRVITRPAGSLGEEHEGVSEEEFTRREAAGDFLITWPAHGLRYGLPASLMSEQARGRHVIANGSRATVAALAGRVPALVVIEVTAPPEALAARIAARGREDAGQREQRLARQVLALPDAVPVLAVENAGTVEEGVAQFIEALTSFSPLHLARALDFDSTEPTVFLPPGTPLAAEVGEVILPHARGGARHRVRLLHCSGLARLQPGELGLPRALLHAWGVVPGEPLMLRCIPPPRERQALRRKIGGGVLEDAQYRRLLREIVEGRYDEREVAAFMVAVTQRLEDEEVLAIAKARAALARQIRWPDDIVVDKHSLGGVPGSRITLIVVPIVAAHGLAIPKTSSRAITSAAGTADVMEVLARVDLDRDEVRDCVRAARACICWNGRLSHSVLDEVMNAMTRPLELDSGKWSVASILSKKKAAGSTHVIIDVPWGPRTKQRTEGDARRLAELFERVGHGLGLTVKAMVTDGRQPIGSGIGPALEMRDVLQVLDNEPDAPADLRDKALMFASHILAWDPRIASLDRGLQRARQLLDNGAAKGALQAIAQAQGAHAHRIPPGASTQDVPARMAGRIADVDGWKISGIARAAGAPADKGAGVDLLCRPGATVRQGDVLYRIHASSPDRLAEGLAVARSGASFHDPILIEPVS